MSEAWLQTYRAKAFDAIEGWVAPLAVDLAGAVDAIQDDLGVPGGVLEIGIYRGRFFIALNGLVHDGSRSLAVDVFDDQHLNIDGSGLGNEAIFRRNLETYDRHRGSNVVIHRADSTTVTPLDLLSRVDRRPRIVSIDGGHTVEHTINDLELARQVVHPQGVVFVDDILNPSWLGVIESVVLWLHQRPTLWPFAIGGNKLLLAPMTHHATYLARLPKHLKVHKTVRFCGYDVLVV
jgi:hypothetical protein